MERTGGQEIVENKYQVVEKTDFILQRSASLCVCVCVVVCVCVCEHTLKFVSLTPSVPSVVTKV